MDDGAIVVAPEAIKAEKEGLRFQEEGLDNKLVEGAEG